MHMPCSTMLFVRRYLESFDFDSLDTNNAKDPAPYGRQGLW